MHLSSGNRHWPPSPFPISPFQVRKYKSSGTQYTRLRVQMSQNKFSEKNDRASRIAPEKILHQHIFSKLCATIFTKKRHRVCVLYNGQRKIGNFQHDNFRLHPWQSKRLWIDVSPQKKGTTWERETQTHDGANLARNKRGKKGAAFLLTLWRMGQEL